MYQLNQERTIEAVAENNLTVDNVFKFAKNDPTKFLELLIFISDATKWDNSVVPVERYNGGLTSHFSGGIKELPEFLGMKIDKVYDEGGGEYTEVVLEVNQGDKSFYVAYYGNYQSYDGTTWSTDDYKIVKPYTFTETRYN